MIITRVHHPLNQSETKKMNTKIGTFGTAWYYSEFEYTYLT